VDTGDLGRGARQCIGRLLDELVKGFDLVGEGVRVSVGIWMGRQAPEQPPAGGSALLRTLDLIAQAGFLRGSTVAPTVGITLTLRGSVGADTRLGDAGVDRPLTRLERTLLPG